MLDTATRSLYERDSDTYGVRMLVFRNEQDKESA